MMVVTSPRLSFFVLGAIPVIVLPLYGFGRLVRRRSRAAQDTLADASAYASELIGAVRVLQAFTNEQARGEPLRRRGRARIRRRARVDAGARDPHGGRDLSRVLQRGRGAVGRRPGRAGRAHDGGAALPVRALRGVRRRRARPAVRGVGRGLAGGRCGRAAVRDPRACGRRSCRPRARSRCPRPRAARSPSRMSVSPIRRGRESSRSTGCRFACGAARRSRSSAPRAPARARSSTSSCGSTIRSPAW